jgi:hypothetical protein
VVIAAPFLGLLHFYPEAFAWLTTGAGFADAQATLTRPAWLPAVAGAHASHRHAGNRFKPAGLASSGRQIHVSTSKGETQKPTHGRILDACITGVAACNKSSES